MEEHVKYMEMAIELAKEGVYPFGTIIVKDGEIIGEASSGDIANDPTAHTETLAIRKACEKLGTNDLTGATIYCTSEPCIMCFGGIYWAGIREVIYAVSIKTSIKNNICSFMKKMHIPINKINRMSATNFNIIPGICEKEALTVMKNWQIRNDDQGVIVKKYILVVGVAFIRDGKLLVSMSQRSAKKGIYTLVGGGVEAGETFKEAARREVMEEIGNRFTIKESELTEILCFREPALSDPTVNIEMHMFISKKDVNVKLKPNDEIREFKWFSLGEDEAILSTAIKNHFLPWARENKIMK